MNFSLLINLKLKNFSISIENRDIDSFKVRVIDLLNQTFSISIHKKNFFSDEFKSLNFNNSIKNIDIDISTQTSRYRNSVLRFKIFFFFL